MNASPNVKESLKNWILKKSPLASAVCDDTQILKEKIISSVQIMDLILYIEHLSGSPVNVEKIQLGSFVSVNSICSTFFEHHG